MLILGRTKSCDSHPLTGFSFRFYLLLVSYLYIHMVYVLGFTMYMERSIFNLAVLSNIFICFYTGFMFYVFFFILCTSFYYKSKLTFMWAKNNKVLPENRRALMNWRVLGS